MGAKKILVVDFDQEFLKFLSQFLRNEGFAVITATDGSVGLEMHKTEAPDLVITEAMLPKLHGFELCSRISHSASRKTPVIIVTGVYRDTVYKTEAMHTFGASAYFEKPLDPDELMVSLRKILNLPAPKERPEDLVDSAIMEALVSETASSPAPDKAAAKSSDGDDIDNMLRSTLAEFDLKPGKKKAPAEALAPKPQVPASAPAPKPSPTRIEKSRPETPAPPSRPEPASDKPVAAAQTGPAVPVPTAPPVWVPQAVVAPSGGEKPRSFEPIPVFDGHSEDKKKGFPPRIFGALAGVILLTSATVFVLKPGKGRVPADNVVPAVVEEVLTGSDDVPPAVDPAAETTAVTEAGNKTRPEPAPAGKDLKAAPAAVEEIPIPKPEDIIPLEPETAPNLEIKATETASSPAGTAAMAVDGGAVPAGTEAPVETPAVKVRAGDLIPLEEADLPPRQIRAADPIYPSAARSLGKEGSIVINVLISETGDVIQTAVIGGDKGSLGFDKAAENAVRKWKFSPAEKNGVPVRVWKSVTIGFKLKK